MSEPRLTDRALYLQRLGFDAPPAPTLETLRQLQLRHTGVFPFENLTTLSGEPVLIDLPSIEQKVLHDGRGGYCYELNNLFLALLQELGFDARAISGRVVMGQPEGSWTARTHRLSLVIIDDVRYITDVGFGGMVPTAPLLLDTRAEQATPHESYRIDLHVDGFTLRANVAGEWRAMYIFDLQRQEDIDFAVGNWYVSTHPESSFVKQLMVARTGEGWRRTLNNGSFAIHRIGHDSERREVTDVQELIGLLGSEFGIRVPEQAQLARTLKRLIAAPQ
ncbi:MULTISPECIES: arylamine N-acetyltransferase family protein [Pseudomonas]|jgi:N-hydroxyarylamine O-acetyltransferase|uniref:N-hydroxyarylamine O-acetyltransferase n=1 Tax=Pseudomonas fluorescens TaxID=294 RepID=A0A5E6QTD3_PSEFL|nr:MULTISPECIES: arylamine N-acetyltransferase [Pseudomonas]MBV7523316.1 arylamine N-acetyltransferase [Pseudomonas sp. PDM29]QHF38460.1 arylamine N-acetyltransferase [Pseudomonas sp. S34]VVM41650.1 N-hydroxyarylamine O-acetyltransferase [Pseudomonas fluorescens]VVM56272.1 N-hydroxyarylamine O-acetyltransferase [Pseudomonas fluorescens]VVM70034.1 N-hydroxyarylamine O-acetyltransferase [Pseudomonas fluorescens]